VPGVDPGTGAAVDPDIIKYPPTITKSRTTTIIAISGPLFIFFVFEPRSETEQGISSKKRKFKEK